MGRGLWVVGGRGGNTSIYHYLHWNCEHLKVEIIIRPLHTRPKIKLYLAGLTSYIYISHDWN